MQEETKNWLSYSEENLEAAKMHSPTFMQIRKFVKTLFH